MATSPATSALTSPAPDLTPGDGPWAPVISLPKSITSDGSSGNARQTQGDERSTKYLTAVAESARVRGRGGGRGEWETRAQVRGMLGPGTRKRR